MTVQRQLSARANAPAAHRAAPARDDARLLDALDRVARAGVGITTRAVAEGGASIDLTLPQWRALVVIAEAGMSGIRVGDLGRAVGVATPGASRLVRRLEVRGLVVVARDHPDRRAVVVRVADAGRALWTAVVMRRRQLIAEALAKVDGGAGAEGFLGDLGDELIHSA